MMKVAITGANGFVGRRLSQWCEDRAYCVREFVRAKPIGNQTAVGALESHIPWEQYLAGLDVVIHTAARVHQLNDTDEDSEDVYHRVNTEATLRLAAGAAASGVKRFVFLSSIKVNGEGTELDSPFTESDSARPQDPYSRSKWQAEQGLMALHNAGEMEIVIIRPPLVYGRGVKANFQKLVKLVASGIPLPLGAIKNRRSMIFIDNLVDFILKAAVEPAASGETFVLSDGEDLSTPELIRYIAQGLNRPARLLPVPVWALIGLGAVTGRSAEISRLVGSYQIDPSHAFRTLNWTPQFTAFQAIQQTARDVFADVKTPGRVEHE